MEAFEFSAGALAEEEYSTEGGQRGFACAGRRAKKNDGTALRFSGMYF